MRASRFRDLQSAIRIIESQLNTSFPSTMFLVVIRQDGQRGLDISWEQGPEIQEVECLVKNTIIAPCSFVRKSTQNE